MVTDLVKLVGGPADGAVVATRFLNSELLQVPVHDKDWNFATYKKDPYNPLQYVFQGFSS